MLTTIPFCFSDIVGIQGDVSVKENIHPLAAETHSRLGDVDVLIHAASYLGTTPLRLLVDTECEDMEQVLQTNVLGPFRLTKAFHREKPKRAYLEPPEYCGNSGGCIPEGKYLSYCR